MTRGLLIVGTQHPRAEARFKPPSELFNLLGVREAGGKTLAPRPPGHPLQGPTGGWDLGTP